MVRGEVYKILMSEICFRKVKVISKKEIKENLVRESKFKLKFIFIAVE